MMVVTMMMRYGLTNNRHRPSGHLSVSDTPDHPRRRVTWPDELSINVAYLSVLSVSS